MSVEQVLGLYNYWIVIVLMMTGFYIVIARNNLVKTVIGLNIFQISVILFYVSIGKVSGGTAPIVPPSLVSHGHAEHAHEDHHATDHPIEKLEPHDLHKHDSHAHDDSHAEHSDGDESHDLAGVDHSDTQHAAGEDEFTANKLAYSNPLPSVLMLTAIVVGIATTALALALIVRIREDYGTIEEDEILELDRAA